jgi:hypothetical protein
MGATTYEFADSTGASYGLQNVVKPWVALLDAPTYILDDLSGNGNTGTLSNVSYASDNLGRAAGALSFNGLSSSINLGTGNSLNIAGAYTICGRFKTTATGGEILARQGGTLGGSTAFGYGVYLSGGKLVAYNRHVATADTATSLTSVNSGEWVHFACVCDSNSLNIYINGTLDKPIAATVPSGGSATAYISGNVASGGYFNGIIQNLRVYGRAFTQADVTADYNGLYVSSTGLVASYGPKPLSSEIDFFLSTHRPKNISYKRDESGNIYELTLYPGNGLIYWGRITYPNLTLDSDSNLIPNCLEASVEGSLAKFLQAYGMVIQ